MKLLWTAPWLSWKFGPENMTILPVFEEYKLRFVPKDITAWVCNPSACFVIGERILDEFPNLEVLLTPSTGDNHVDLLALQERGIAFRSLLDDRDGLNTITASSEFTFLGILSALRRPDRAFLEMRWHRDEEFLRGRELYGKKVGIVGYGRIGKNIDRWCRAFGANVLYAVDKENQSDLVPLFGNSDIVVVSCSLTEKTRGFIGKQLLESMKPWSFLINTSRGEVFARDALETFLRQRFDVTAFLDVIPGEVNNSHWGSELLKLSNVIITPHVAGTTWESQEKAAKIILKILEDFNGQKE